MRRKRRSMSKCDLSDGSVPFDEDIFADIPMDQRPLATNVTRIFDGTIFWQCSACGARIEVDHETRNEFIQSCESCYTVNRIVVRKTMIVRISAREKKFREALEAIVSDEKRNTWMKNNGFPYEGCEPEVIREKVLKATQQIAREALK